MTNKNRKILIISIVIIVSLIGIYFFINSSSKEIEPPSKKPNNNQEQVTNKDEIIGFLKEVVGVKAEDVEIVNDPVGIRGKFLAPKQAILNGVDYFLKDTNNENIKNIEISIGSGYIELKTEYVVNKFITTPIEVKVKPYLDNDKNLILEVYDLKFLDLKVADWIVNIGINGFVQDLFTKESELIVSFNDGKVIIDKSNFKEITLEKILIKKTQMSIDMFINLEELL